MSKRTRNWLTAFIIGGAVAGVVIRKNKTQKNTQTGGGSLKSRIIKPIHAFGRWLTEKTK